MLSKEVKLNVLLSVQENRSTCITQPVTDYKICKSSISKILKTYKVYSYKLLHQKLTEIVSDRRL